MTPLSPVICPSTARIEREADGVRLAFTIPEDFYFCRGHFPGQPIVPGAVIVSWMLEVAVQAGWDGQDAGRLKRLKFRSSLVPGDPVEVAARICATGVCVTVRSGGCLCADADFPL